MSGDTSIIRFDKAKASEEAEKPAEPTDGSGEQSVSVPATPSAAPQQKLQVGRGLDVGTANVLSAFQDENGEVTVKRERNAFLEIPAHAGGNKEMLTRLNVPYVSYQDNFYVLGDASFHLANMFGKEVRRPMQDGFLSPNEQDAVPIMRFLVDRLLGRPQTENEPVFFCIPATSIDRENDTVYHEGIVSGILKKLGFEPRSMNEGHAIVYAELADADFTGIAVSCGGGMFNVCVSYKTIPAVTFSVARGGDWIDEHVAKVMGLPKVRATAIKEGGLNLMQPKSREEEAVVLYYRNLISYVLENLKQRFQLARDVPQFTDPVDVVVAGGTSLVGGFVEVFAEELQKVKFPLEIASVRRADDAISSVVRGTLMAAALANESE
ncbi:MAG: disk-shape morphogenesis protein volactin [Planctomycetota bacterium]|jgi:actin-like ATPase involved in cell morphogenesis